MLLCTICFLVRCLCFVLDVRFCEIFGAVCCKFQPRVLFLLQWLEIMKSIFIEPHRTSTTVIRHHVLSKQSRIEIGVDKIERQCKHEQIFYFCFVRWIICGWVALSLHFWGITFFEGGCVRHQKKNPMFFCGSLRPAGGESVFFFFHGKSIQWTVFFFSKGRSPQVREKKGCWHWTE